MGLRGVDRRGGARRALAWRSMAVAASLLLGGAAAAQAPVVQVEGGRLLGLRADQAVSYRGVPFAASPTGELRWRPPAPAPAWSGVRDATRFGAACVQPHDPDGHGPVETSEDCLFLNVWTPIARHAGRSPVLVWIHGGGWRGGTGADPAFDGSAFARDGVVVVTVNYRLGPLGFFAHPALTREAAPDAPLADYGLMDNIAALQWVRRNVAAFGGDPARVTVAGESAGAGQVLQLLALPEARGLFAQAIVESGPAFGPMTSLAQAEQAGAAVAAQLGLPEGADAEALRRIPAADLLKAARGAAPILDGRLVKAPPFASLGREGAKVPLLIGTNSDEGSLVPYYGAAADAISALYRPWAADLPALYGADAGQPGLLKRDLFADTLFAAPARQIAAVSPRAYLYRFDHPASAIAGTVRGAPHGAEMIYVFETLDTGRRPASDADRRVAALVHACWASFVAQGRPACPTGQPWPVYRPAGDALMDFGAEDGEIRRGFQAPRMDFVAQHILAARPSSGAAADEAKP